MGRKPKAHSKTSQFFGVGILEPKTLNFQALAQANDPSKKWKDIPFNIRVQLIRDELTPKNSLIDPNCSYMKHWDIMIILALVYTALVTPFEVGFLETKLNGLFVFNRFIDVIFVKDMIMQFFIKIRVRKKTESFWLRDQKKIAMNYLKGWFIIDILSILPFDVLGFFLKDPAIQKMKVIRVIRIMRLLKIARVLRASRIVKRWQNHTNMTYSQQGLVKFGVILCVSSHWMSCVWGGAGKLLGTNLECEDGKMVNVEGDIDGGSWITGHSWGPDSPCATVDVYLTSLHFAVMTITSIGYGDITPTRKWEYVIGILLQMTGGLIWAYVIGSICGIISNANPIQVEFENSMDALNRMLTEQNVEQQLRYDLREYLREQQYHNYLERARAISVTFSPQLQGRLLNETVMGAAINKVWYLRDCEEQFRVKIAASFIARQFSKGDTVGAMRVLCVLQRGSVAWNGRVLLPGHFWGEDMIVSSVLLQHAFPHAALAMHYVEVLELTQDDMEEILEQFPKSRLKIRKAACIIAFRTTVRLLTTAATDGSVVPSPLNKTKKRSVVQQADISADSIFVLKQLMEEARGIGDEANIKAKWATSTQKGEMITMEQVEDELSILQEVVKQDLPTRSPKAAYKQSEASSQEGWVQALIASVESLKTETASTRREVASVRKEQAHILELLQAKEAPWIPGQIVDKHY